MIEEILTVSGREVRAVIEPLARGKALEFKERVEEGVETVRTDPSKLRQVLGGTLQMQSEPGRGTRVEVSLGE